MVETSDRPGLEYARPVPWGRRWRLRLLVLMAATGCIVLAFDRYGPRTRSKAELLYWQRQCLRHSAAPDVLVYQTDSSERYRPECWSRFRRMIGTPAYSRWPESVTFLGERRTKTGKTVLVAAVGNHFPPDVVAIEPATPFGAPRVRALLEVRVGMGWFEVLHANVTVRRYAGQPDSADPARFTLPVDVGGQRKVVTAALDEDGSAVYFTVSEGAGN